MIALGTVVDLASYTFRVSSRRAEKLEKSINELH